MKKVYITPEITVVTFKVEHGLTGSDQATIQVKFGDYNASRWENDYDSYATSNETFTDYSDKSGNATAGKWN